MIRNRLYYSVKPLLPRPLRMSMRRKHAASIRRRSGHIWPINKAAGRTPHGWPGWPGGKQFALVLSHDIESPVGLSRVRQVAELEMELGLRSSFNFVPEGDYRVSDELRGWLVDNGFEVGVHDLHHDGLLYSSREGFRRKARRINEYVKEWDAAGFRSGFMLRRLEWIHDLEILYDASTFDSDPFEPQPDGAGTIFPFWVADKNGGGYVELPYSLSQDTTLFLLLHETDTCVWDRKLEWIAGKGGMALMNTHPDHMCFDEGSAGRDDYPVALYERFLRELTVRHEGRFWHALPREAAAFAREHREALKAIPVGADSNGGVSRRRTGKIWIDLENTPHIPFFAPIIKELERRGHTVVLTARDAFQTCEMAAQYDLPYVRIGRHYGKKRFLKVFGLLRRGLQLIPFARKERPALGLNHGARAQILACNLLRVPTIMLMDYEHTKTLPLVRPTWEIVPDVLPDDGLHCQTKERIKKYSGIKEDVYVPFFEPDPSILSSLNLNGGIIVTVRPPATEAHYHNPEAEVLFKAFMERVHREPGVQAVLLPRNQTQQKELRAEHPEWFKESKVVIPEKAVDGLNLLWHSDLVVSGGGTMNREAAALGVPVYSIFRGKIGAVDQALQAEGRLMLVKSVDEVRNRIPLQARSKAAPPKFKECTALNDIVTHIESVLALQESEGH